MARLTTSEICRIANKSRQTITRWRALGILPPPIAKTSDGSGVVAYYDEAQTRAAIETVEQLRARGWSLPAIAAKIKTKNGDER